MKKNWYLSITSAFMLATSFAGTPAPSTSPDKVETSQPPAGVWQRADQLALEKQVQQRVASGVAVQDVSRNWLPVVQEFKALIENDPELYMLFIQMFEQIPRTPSFLNDPMGNPQVRSYLDMLHLINQNLTQAPEFNKTDLVGFPINAIVNWAMGTPAGASAFLNPKVNQQLKKILAQWGVFLKSADSLTVLNNHPEKGWFGRDALQAMPTLLQDFELHPKEPHYGFKSWDDFFVRRFREGRRPLASPGDDNVIANACESAPYK